MQEIFCIWFIPEHLIVATINRSVAKHCVLIKKRKKCFSDSSVITFLKRQSHQNVLNTINDDVNNKKNTLTNVVCVLGLVFDDNKLHAR